MNVLKYLIMFQAGISIQENISDGLKEHQDFLENISCNHPFTAGRSVSVTAVIDASS